MRGMIAVISWISGSSSPAAMFGCAEKRLLDQRGAGARKAHDEDRLRHVRAHPGTWDQAQPPPREKAAQPIQKLPRLVVPVRLAGQFARQLLGFRTGRPGIVVAAELVEQAPLLQHLVGTKPALVIRRCVDQSQRLVELPHAAKQHRTRQVNALIVGELRVGLVENSGGCGKVAVRLFQPREAEQS